MYKGSAADLSTGVGADSESHLAMTREGGLWGDEARTLSSYFDAYAYVQYQRGPQLDFR